MTSLTTISHLPVLVYTILIAAYAFTIVSCIVVILSENRNPIRSIAWVTALICLPLVGLVFYLFFGRSLHNLHLISRHNKRKLLNKRRPWRIDLDALKIPDSDKRIIRLANSLNQPTCTTGNSIQVFTSGQQKFEQLKHDLRNARHSIFLQYYIFSDDALGQEIADILMAKAAEGVTVKVIYDHVGSFSSRSKFFNNMRRHGVDAQPFFRVTFPQLANRINWRNHRKIVVIDNSIGYIGGMNIATRYADPKSWRDTHYRVTGPVVDSLMYSFAIDWNFTNNPLTLPEYQPQNDAPGVPICMQLVTSGPNDTWHSLSLCFLKAISSAKRCIYIQTPYFLPTESLMNALRAAALSGIDVRIVIPRKSDSRMLQLASFSYVTQCLKADIKVYLYMPGMIHAKMMIVDDSLVTTGSTNFDFRSFENNFECNLFVYDNGFNAQMREIFFEDLKQCTKLTYSKWHRRPRLQRGLESMVRLFAPIL